MWNLSQEFQNTFCLLSTFMNNFEKPGQVIFLFFCFVHVTGHLYSGFLLSSLNGVCGNIFNWEIT